MNQAAQLVVLGARGSIPISGRDYVGFGGNTSCFAISEDDTMIGVIDAGTGLVRLDEPVVVVDERAAEPVQEREDGQCDDERREEQGAGLHRRRQV